MIAADRPATIEGVRLLVIASALELYAKTGIKANRAYTPSAMLRAAAGSLGRSFKRGAYLEAAAALRVRAAELRNPALPVYVEDGSGAHVAWCPCRVCEVTR